MPSFGTTLSGVLTSAGHLCVGIDPHPYLLAAWNLPDSPEGIRELGLRVVEATAGRAGMIKPQVAFFERHGSAGYHALEDVIAAARDAGVLVIADAKRGDLGTSVEAYAQAWLTPGAPLEVDAMTMSAFQGVGSLDASLRLAGEYGKGVFVLAATSNPEARSLQTARQDSSGARTVAGGIVDEVREWNAASAGLGHVGVVIGATIHAAEFGIELADLATTPILAPGFGHQGARVSDIHRLYGPAAGNVVVNASRSILEAGPDGIGTAIQTQAAELAEVYRL